MGACARGHRLRPANQVGVPSLVCLHLASRPRTLQRQKNNPNLKMVAQNSIAHNLINTYSPPP